MGCREKLVDDVIDFVISNMYSIPGLLVTTTGGRGIHVNGSYIRFAQRHEHHESKQPILVIFTDDGRSRHPSYISPDDEGKYSSYIRICNGKE